jgi:peptidoglycan/LPS O-acetylase OafA/YrhL
MENENYPIGKHALYYGIYTGLGLILISLIFYLLDIYGDNWTSYISYLILLLGIVLSSLYYRDNRLNGQITYGTSVSAGFLTGLFAGIIASIFTYIFITYLGEEFIREALERAEEEMIESRPDMSDEELDLALIWTEKMMKPAWLSIISVLSYAFFSIIFALIASIFIKKEDQSLEVNN